MKFRCCAAAGLGLFSETEDCFLVFKFTEAAFEGGGCAISVASASLLTDVVTGISKQQALACCDEVTGRLCAPDSHASQETGVDLDKIRALDGVRDYPSRVKCATLAWHALRSALEGESGQVSTE